MTSCKFLRAESPGPSGERGTQVLWGESRGNPREAHDASPFYERFTAPDLSDDETVNPCRAADHLVCGDARDMRRVDDCSVALVVTSPPYFAGKEYEAALGEGHVPGSYLEYLEMLRDVFAECGRVLEPGGRIAGRVG